MHMVRKLALAGLGGLGGALLRRALARRESYDFAGRVAVITGGSRGLGLALARELAAEGATLALLARDEAELGRAREDLVPRGATVQTIVCDVREQAQVRAAIAKVVEQHGRLDVLINNAGVIQVSPLEHLTLEDFKDAVDTHLWGPLYTTLAALPQLRRQGGGRIVNISSIGGKLAVPHLLPYSTSKFALVGLSDGLRAELAKDGVVVTTVCPGLMRTGSHLNAYVRGQHQQEFTWFALFDSLPVTSMAVQRAARQIVEACRSGDPELTITLQARLLALSNAVFPGLTARAMQLMNKLLPGPTSAEGDLLKQGWDSQSVLAPSLLTLLGDRANTEYNGTGGHEPIVSAERHVG